MMKKKQVMKKRGGGIKDLFLKDKTDDIPNYYQLEGHFDTVDSMGANFINSILEAWSEVFEPVWCCVYTN